MERGTRTEREREGGEEGESCWNWDALSWGWERSPPNGVQSAKWGPAKISRGIKADTGCGNQADSPGRTGRFVRIACTRFHVLPRIRPPRKWKSKMAVRTAGVHNVKLHRGPLGLSCEPLAFIRCLLAVRLDPAVPFIGVSQTTSCMNVQGRQDSKSGLRFLRFLRATFKITGEGCALFHWGYSRLRGCNEVLLELHLLLVNNGCSSCRRNVLFPNENTKVIAMNSRVHEEN